MFKGRYLNGNATFNLSFQDGRLSVTPQTILVKGEPLPEVYLQEIRKQNLAVAFTNDPGAAAVLKGLEEIQVKEGKLVIAPRNSSDEPTAMREARLSRAFTLRAVAARRCPATRTGAGWRPRSGCSGRKRRP